MNEITARMIWQAAAGNQQAITQLYELTYSSVYKTVRAMVQDEDTVLDIVQDSYIKGFQSLDQLDAPENFRAWMKRIATNKAKDHLKKKKPILFSELSSDGDVEFSFQDDRLDHCPEEVIDQQETKRLMNEILGTLSEEQRLVIGMFYYEELSVREIAEILGCSENTVKSRLSYGRKKVEMKVRELERKGTKLYSLAPLPFLLWLFRLDAQAAEIPSPLVRNAVTSACARATGSAAGAGTAGTSGAAPGAASSTPAPSASRAPAPNPNAARYGVNPSAHRSPAPSASTARPAQSNPSAARPAAGAPNTARPIYANANAEALAAARDAAAARAAAESSAKGTSRNSVRHAGSTGAKATATTAARYAAKSSGKSLATKLIAGVLAVSVVGGGAAAAVNAYKDRKAGNAPAASAGTHNSSQFELPPQTVPAAEDPGTFSSAAVDAAYQVVENNYLATLQMRHEDYQAAEDAGNLDSIYNGDHRVIWYYHHMGDDRTFWTARADLDGNGVEELLVGTASGAYPEYVSIVDIYGFDGTQAVQLIDEPTLGDRSQLHVLRNGTLFMIGGGGAVAGDSYEYWKVVGASLTAAEPSDAPETDDLLNWQYLGGMDSSAPPETQASNQVDDQAMQYAYEAVKNRYYEACAIDHQEWMNNLDAYTMQYSDLASDALLYYHMLEARDRFFVARHDLDGNGVDELFIATGEDEQRNYVVAIYAFDGYSAVTVCNSLFEVLADGTILVTDTGNNIAQVLRLAPDGHSLTDAAGSIVPGDSLIEVDAAAHNGWLELNWEYLCG